MGETIFIPSGMQAQPPERNAAWEAVAAELGVDPKSMNAGDVATSGAVKRGFGDDRAITWFGSDGSVERMSYSELDERSARAASLFAGAGVKSGDRILVMLPTVPELFYAALGALRAGAQVSVLPPSRNAEGVRFALERINPRILVTLPTLKSILGSQRTPGLERIYYVNRTTFTLPELADFETVWADALGAAAPTVPPVQTAAGDGALINGLDTGRSASIMSHEAALGLALTARAALGWTPREGAVLALVPGEAAFLPYFVLAPFLCGVHLVCHEDPARFTRHADVAEECAPKAWFSSFKALDVMIRTDPNLGTLLKGCTTIAVTHPADPTFLTMSSVSWPAPVRTVWLPQDVGVIQSSGAEDKVGSAGRPVSGAEIRVVDEGGKEIPPGQSGVLAIRLGPSAPFLGFWQDPDQTASRRRDGWFFSPHRGRVDTDGIVWVES